MTEGAVQCALIPAAGMGTRFLPVTKAVPKELLPLGALPVIHLLVAEALAGGATEVVIVISPDKQAIRDYFSPDSALQCALAAKGKAAALAPLTELLDQVNIRFAVQNEPRGLGHAVLCGAEAVGERPFLVLLGDAPILATTPVCRQLAACYQRCRASVLGLQEVPDERTQAYGIVAGDPDPAGSLKLHTLVEKPPPGTAPGNLAISGRYLLTPAVFDLLRRQAPGVGGEIQLTDAIAALLEKEPVYGEVYEGRRYDIGNPAGYLEAQIAYRDVDPG